MVNNTKSADISSTGSAHRVHSNRTSLSFGTWPGEDLRFDTEEKREQYYIENILKEYKDVTEPTLTWSHNYTNIPLYRKNFKNSKILVITHSNIEERVTCMIMNITKTLMDKNANIPLKDITWEKMLLGWQRFCSMELCHIIGRKMDVSDLFKDRYDSKYYDLLLFATLRSMAKHFGVLKFFDVSAGPEYNVFDKVLYLVKHPTMLYCIGQDIEEFTDQSDVRLPYSYLVNNDEQLLIDALSKILSRDLSATERSFVSSEFLKYRAAQDQKILTDPKQFYLDAREKGLINLKEYLDKK
jgi:hypothetical protein